MAIRMKREWSAVATQDEAEQHGLSASEFQHIQNILGRAPSVLETGIFAALYSEHCSYKSTKAYLKNLPTTGTRVIQGPGENAGVVDIGDGLAVVFKVESHNHPSFIEPFQGAATGVGGIIRDVFTMGARPLALMNGLRFGSPNTARTPYLVTRAVKGIGFYGNCVGIPTVGGELFFHDSYDGNCLVNAFCLGLVRSDAIFYGRAAGVGNSVFYVGSKTGRDGIHGATMASESFDENSQEKRPTVQVGDPFQEKLLLEACLEVMGSGAVVGIQDMGAAGLTSSTYEMASRAGLGVRMHLDRVPQREEGMTPYEIMLSESQERMLMVVQSGREDEVRRIVGRYDLDAVQIGEIIAEPFVELFWHGEKISALAPALLTESVPPARWPLQPGTDGAARAGLKQVDPPKDLAAAWIDLLGSVNCCSRQIVYEQYDSTIRSNTVIHPGGDAAVIRIKESPGGKRGVAMTLDCNSRYCGIDPRQGAALSVAEACRNLAAVGAEPIGMSDCLNYGSPQKPEGMWQIAEGIGGIGEAARAFEVPVVSGNVSLYNETMGRPILPTPMLAVVGLVDDVDCCVPSAFRGEGDIVFLIGTTSEVELGGSEYLAAICGIEGGELPLLNYDLEMKTNACVRKLVRAGLLRSCHDVSSGGLAVALSECCISGPHAVGVMLQLAQQPQRPDALLFAETGARFIVSVGRDMGEKVRDIVTRAGLTISAEGVTGGEAIAIEQVAKIPLKEAFERWRSGLVPLFNGTVSRKAA